MKKFIVILLVVISSFASLFASFDYSLDFFSFDPLHKVYIADKNSHDIEFNCIANFGDKIDHIFQDTRYGEINPHRYEIKEKDLMDSLLQIKLADGLCFFRNTFSFDSVVSPIAFELIFQPSLNSLIDTGFHGVLAYETIWLAGINVSVADKVTFRAGLHHYCNHYGDMLLNELTEADRGDIDLIYKYARMHTMAFGVSIEPIEGVRIYGEFDMPYKGTESLRPYTFQPSWMENSIYPGKYPDQYKARIINFGFELSHTFFPQLGKTTFAYDLHLYEEGQIVYKNADGSYITDPKLIVYDPSRPWRQEHSVVLNQRIAPYFSIELQFCYGYTPLNMFYYIEDTSWLSIGFKFDPDVSIPIIR